MEETPNHSQLSSKLVDTGVIKIALCTEPIKCASVVNHNLLNQGITALFSLTNEINLVFVAEFP